MSNQEKTTAVAIFEPQNVQTIVQMGPMAYNENTVSHTRCIAAGQMLLDRIKTEGMNDAIDQEVAHFIEKAKITVKKMNGKRSPVTKLFDQLRTVYTTLENEVDPTKAGSVPYQLQQQRNAYAAKKHAEAEAARRAEMLRQQQEQARIRYRADVEDDYKTQFNALIVRNCNELGDMDRSITLDNYEIIYDGIKNFSVEMPDTWGQTVQSGVRLPSELTIDESKRIQASVLSALLGQFKEQFAFEVSSTRDDILVRMPSKKTELQRIAQASAEEAARIKAQMEERERAEAQRKEQERIERERKEKAAAELAAQKQEMDGLFGIPVAAVPTYQPKTQVKKRIVIETPDDIMAVVACWWSQEGCKLPLDDLVKTFKKQITFCEKLANDKNNPITISNVRYEDEVKAK